MMRSLLILLLTMSLSFIGSTRAFAEGNCPPGYYQTPGTDFVGCAPLPGYGGGSPPDPGPAWRSRWGAIATANGAFGTANDQSSARNAEKVALKQCKAKGGKDCGIRLSFGNQCAAMAWGDAATSSEPGENIAQAEASALQSCSQRTRHCKVFYSACSYPERIR